MSTETPRDQPSGVATEDQPRPQDEHVVTSDVIQEPPATPKETEIPGESQAAADTKKNGDGSNLQDSATANHNDNPAPKRRYGAERRIKKLNRELSATKARDADNQRRIAELEATVQGLKQSAPKPAEPQLEDFASPQEYAKAYSQWESDTQPPSPTAPQPSPQPAPATPDTPVKPNQEIAEFQQRGQEKLGDEFVEAFQETGTAVNTDMGDYILDSDYGPEILVHLTNNPDDALKIFNASTLRIAKAMQALEEKAKKGELDVGEEGQLQVEPTHDSPTKKQAVSNKATHAPAPPSSTKDGANVNLAADPENEGMDDYAARRHKEEMRRRGYSTS